MVIAFVLTIREEACLWRVSRNIPLSMINEIDCGDAASNMLRQLRCAKCMGGC